VFDAVPSDSVGYVFSAYLFFLLMVLVYIAILGAKFLRINRELGDLIDEMNADREDRESRAGDPDRVPAESGSPAAEESSV
jgi:hypothetical protein